MSFLSTFARLDATSHFTVTEVYSRRSLVVLVDASGRHHLARVDGRQLPVGAVVEGPRPERGASVMTCTADRGPVTVIFLDIGCELLRARQHGSWRDPCPAEASEPTHRALHGPNG